VSVDTLGKRVIAAYASILGVGVQAYQFSVVVSAVLSQKLQQCRGDRVSMCWIMIKRVATHQNVFRVGGFIDQYAARLQHAPCLGGPAQQLFEWNVLNDMECRDGTQAGVRLLFKPVQGVCVDNIQLLLVTAADHDWVGINASGGVARFVQQVQPLAAAAANVEYAVAVLVWGRKRFQPAL